MVRIVAEMAAMPLHWLSRSRVFFEVGHLFVYQSLQRAIPAHALDRLP
jgi:hypothetical protein